MTEIDKTTDTSSNIKPSDLSSPHLPFSEDCSPFLNWKEEELESEQETAGIFQSLVATVKLQPVLDVSLEAKAVKFLEYVIPNDRTSTEVFLNSHGRTTDESLTNFIQSIGVLISSASQAITTASMEILEAQLNHCSEKLRLTFVKADLIPQLINTLNPLSLSFAEAVDIHASLMTVINQTVFLATQDGLEDLEIEEDDEQQIVHDTVLEQVLIPSEKYIWHLCVNRFSIIDDDQSEYFLELLARLLHISPYHQPTMDFVLHMPVVLANQLEWNRQCLEVRKKGKTVQRMLRMEGIEEVNEAKLRNNKTSTVIGILSRQSCTIIPTLTFTATLALLPLPLSESRCVDLGHFVHLALFPCSSIEDSASTDSKDWEDVLAQCMPILDSFSDAIHAVTLTSVSPSPH
ncbi:hypothetical protein BLNAU_8411 [Blattamonas nauphoetae]|uniref:Uncharacterized protein n=1 Tax=Blattamonas nauphoetae TaxID=2049346 RepID=A0ABQ9XYN4_9EUKA|nr:hypothetical protein BLNAU_8411 [Blattamonas nauphoetae]